MTKGSVWMMIAVCSVLMIRTVGLVWMIKRIQEPARITWGLPGLCFPGLEGLRSDPPAMFTFVKLVVDMM